MDELQEMLDAFWNYLHGRPAYTALNLQEFPLYDGRRLLPQISQTGVLIPDDKLPAFACMDVAVEPSVLNEPSQFRLQATLDMRVIVIAQGDNPHSSIVTAPTMTILRELMRTQARVSGLESGGIIQNVDVRLRSIDAVQGISDAVNLINYWVSVVQVILRRTWRPS